MENIQVAIRLRPLSTAETLQGEDTIWGIHQPHHIYLQPSLQKELVLGKRLVTGSRTTFTFDSCFSPNERNEFVYGQCVRNIVLGSLKGINGTVFVYGQTGSGKTYTMLGPHERRHEVGMSGPDQGILFQSLRELFENIERDLDKTYVLRCSYIEIYNEQIFDLLKPPSRLAEVLTINEDTKKEFFVKGVTEESVSSVEEILDVLQRGELNRHYAQTSMNHHSSRSHAIFRLTVQSITNNFIRNYRREQSQLKLPTIQQLETSSSELSDSTEQVDQLNGALVQGALITESILNFVDLAGSEKVSNHTNGIDESFAMSVADSRFEDPYASTATHRAKDRVKEGQYINKSLFFLTQVIFLKAEDKGYQFSQIISHIPYRNSSLTKILRSSLGGNSRTLIILCINPTHSQFEYSLSTIRFGMNAKKIENKVRANIRNHNDDEAIKIIISEYEKKIRDLEKAKSEDKETLEFMKDQLQQKTMLSECLQQRLETVNRKNFQMTQPPPPPRPALRRLVTSVQEVKQRQGIHLDNVGDLIVPTRGKCRIKVDVALNKPIQHHDCPGRIALAAFKAQKQRSNTLQQQIGLLLENYYKIKEEFLGIFTQAASYRSQVSRLKEDLDTYSSDYKELYRKSEEMARTLDMTQLPKLSDQKLHELRSFYDAQVAELGREGWRRELLKQLQIKPPNQSNDSVRKLMDQFKAHTTSQDSLVNYRDPLCEDKVVNALYTSLDEHEKHLQQVRELGQGRRVVQPHALQPKSPRDTQIKFEKSSELDKLFFDRFVEQDDAHLLTFEQLQEEMSRFEPAVVVQTSPESSPSPSPKRSTRSFAITSPQHDDAYADSEIITIFDHIQTQEVDPESERLKRTFTQALMDFIAEVDKDKVNRFIKDTDISHQGNSAVASTHREPSAAGLQRHKTETYTQSQTQLLKRSQHYKTPDYRQQRTDKPASTTPITVGKPKPGAKVSADRNANKSQTRYATNLRRQAAQDSSNQNSTNNMSKRSSTNTAPKAQKGKSKKNENTTTSSVLLVQQKDDNEGRVRPSFQRQPELMQDITNSPTKGRSSQKPLSSYNTSPDEYFDKY